MAELFNNMKVINKFNGSDVTKRVNFINVWLVSISGLQMLCNLLNRNQNKYYITNTRRLNQDCLENLFGTIRTQNGNNMNPTPVQFINVFKNYFTLNILNNLLKLIVLKI